MTDKQRESQIKDDIPQDSGGVKVSADQNSDAGSVRGEGIQKALSPEKKPEETISKGENVFNKTVYTGLNYWANLIMSVGIADYFVNLGGRKKLDSWIDKTTGLVTKMNVPLKKAYHHTKIGWESLIFLAGGFVLLIPLKIMEDNKRPIVHWLNKKLGVEQKTEDGKEKTPAQIHIEEEQPKQSWGNVLWRRLVGTVAVVSSGMAIDHFWRAKEAKLPREVYNYNGQKLVYEGKAVGGQKRLQDFIFKGLDKAAVAIKGQKINQDKIVGRWAKLAILDSMFTVITAVIMKATNGAKKGKMPQEIDNTNDSPVVENNINRIVTADEKEKEHKVFCERVEKRAKDIIDYKHGSISQAGSFVDAIQQKDSNMPVQAGI